MDGDKELFELAAKSAGIQIVGYDNNIGPIVSYGIEFNGARTYWNPLTDDGDALRLAVKLRLSVHVDTNMTDVEDCTEAHFRDPYAATRRAIVRAAAEIGKTL